MGYLSIKYLMFLLNAIYLYQSYFNTDLCNIARPIKKPLSKKSGTVFGAG